MPGRQKRSRDGRRQTSTIRNARYSLTSVQYFGGTRIVTNTRRVVTIECEGGDLTMDDQGSGPGPRPEGGERSAEAGTAAPLPYEGVWRFTAPAVEASVPQARHAVRDLLLRQGVPVADDVV